MSDDIVARLFVGGPLHGQRRVVNCAFFHHVCSDGDVRYAQVCLARQVQYFADDETVARTVYPRVHVMLDKDWHRKITHHETMRETVREIEEMITDGDWNWALHVASERKERTNDA